MDDNISLRILHALERIANALEAQPSLRDQMAMADAVNDLDALTAHQPVDPQTLEPGQKFRFEDATKYQEFRAIKSQGRMVGLSDWRTFEFVTGARVIPLPDDME